MSRRRRHGATTAAALGLLLAAGFAVSPSFVAAAESRCFGTPANGRIANAVRLPESGPNFGPYSRLGVWTNRTFAHSHVAAAISTAYTRLARDRPGTRFIYGEAGWPEGGRFRPHRTHQNGTSVDFFVPVIDARGRPADLPVHALNRFGYDLEFDSSGRLDDLRIDFEAMADHLRALHAAAAERGIGIGRVIFDPPLLGKLFAARNGEWLKANLTFMRTPAWVRHDEHYHVDFAVSCGRG